MTAASIARALNFKEGIDRVPWRMEPSPSAAQAAGVGFTQDLRNDSVRNPLLMVPRTVTVVDAFDPTNGSWFPSLSAAVVPTVGAGMAAVWHPSAGRTVGNPNAGGGMGTIASGPSTTGATLSAISSAVSLNIWANRGDGFGVEVRIIGNSSGGSGKTEVSRVTKNTNGTSPTITWDTPTSFTPAVGDGIEVLEGTLFVVGSGAAAFRGINHQGASAALSATNLPTSATDGDLLCFAEVHVSNDRKPHDGYIDTGATYNRSNSSCCQATATSSTSITSDTLVNPSSPSLFTNEYRNFQIRIVEDITTPTAVGQRRQITSHTSGATPVFTVPTWTVTPSSNAKFVVEQNNDLLAFKTGGSANWYVYHTGSNAWDTTTYTATGAPTAGAGYFSAPTWGITRDPTGVVRQSFINACQAGGQSGIVFQFDLAGGANGVWNPLSNYPGPGGIFSTGACAVYDPVCNGGRYTYVSIPTANLPHRMGRYDALTNSWTAYEDLLYPSGTPVVGHRLGIYFYRDDSGLKMPILYQLGAATQSLWSKPIVF